MNLVKNSVLKLVVFSVLVLGFCMINSAAFKKTYVIDPSKCNNDAACVDVCPIDAIFPYKYKGKDVYLIDPNICNNDALCVDVCPTKAISLQDVDLSKAITYPKKADKKKK